MLELGSPQRGLPGPRAPDHDHDQNSLVIKLLTVGIVLLITLINLLIIRKKMEILIIQSNKKLAEEEVSSPSVIMKNAETQTEDSMIFRSIETQTEKDANEPSSISVSSPKILVSSATPASSSTISPHTPRRGAAAASPNPSPCTVMFERRISPETLRVVRDG